MGDRRRTFRMAGRLQSCLLAALFVGAVAPVVMAASPATIAASRTYPPLTVMTIVTALRRANLSIVALHRQPIGNDNPSGPPPTERQAWGFSLRGVRHGDGRLLLFATARRRDAKAAWFQRNGVRVLVYRTAILWLDRAVAPGIVARCHRALEGIR